MHAGSTKRKKAPVRCAAANDDDDFGSVFDAKDEPPSRRAREGGGGASGSEAGVAAGQQKAKRQKEFAWMDSDDEGSEQKDEPDSVDDADKPKEDAPKEETVSVEQLDEVNSFGRMMLIEPAVRSRLRAGALSPAEAAAACRALARTKFFDRELLDDLYKALRSLLTTGKLTASQTSDLVRCMKTLNAHDRDVCSTIVRCWSSKLGDLEVATRNEWLEAFKGFNHQAEPEFLQMLEVPPVPPMHPNYKKVRCFHFSRGSCVLMASCTFSHDQRAPLSLTDGTKEDWWRCKSSIMMTQNQKALGHGSYGTGPLGVNPM